MSKTENSKPKLELILKSALPKLKKIPMFHVCLINDDFTPMDFVIDLLERFFYKDHATAVHLMLQVHSNGKAICGTYTKEIAETKALLVNDYAQANEHPLICRIEPASTDGE